MRFRLHLIRFPSLTRHLKFPFRFSATFVMAFSSMKCAKFISSFASQIYFFLIIFQIPLFRFPCRIGTCSTPIEYTMSQLIGSEILPVGVVKILLYPGALAEAIVKKGTIPSYNNLLMSRKFTNTSVGTEVIDDKHIEVLAGSYFSLAGAFTGLLKSGRISLLGTSLIIWGIFKEVVFGKHSAKDPTKAVCIYWTMSVAVLSAFFSVRADVRKLIRSCKLKSFLNRVKNYSEDEYK